MAQSANAAPQGHPPVPGPHLCNQIGHNVIGFLKAVLSERCDSGGGSLSKEDIVRILEQLSASTRMFPLYEAAYVGCDQARKTFHNTSFNRETLTRFVTLAVFRDAIQLAFHAAAQSYDHSWQSTFASALIQYMDDTFDIDVAERLMAEYRRLSAAHGTALTPGMLLEDKQVIETAAMLVAAIGRIHAEGGASAAALMETVNNAIKHAFPPSQQKRKLITAHSLHHFLDIAHCKSNQNHFRNVALDAKIVGSSEFWQV